MEFVTGKAGTNHISGADMAAMYRGLLIADDVVLSEGDKLACTMLDANTAQIGTGSCMLQAHHCRVETAEQVAIESGSPGFKRNDLIVARYSKGDGNIQAIYLAVIKGTAVAGEPSDPAVTTGSIDGGDVLVEFPLWRIPIDGVSVGTPERVMPTVDTLQGQISDNAAAIATLGESVSNIPIFQFGGALGRVHMWVDSSKTITMMLLDSQSNVLARIDFYADGHYVIT